MRLSARGQRRAIKERSTNMTCKGKGSRKGYWGIVQAISDLIFRVVGNIGDLVRKETNVKVVEDTVGVRDTEPKVHVISTVCNSRRLV